MSRIKVIEKVIDSNNLKFGKGGNSSLSGVMAAGIISTISQLCLKKNCKLNCEKYILIGQEADKIQKELLESSNDDEIAFCKIKEAYSLPHFTEEEKKNRRLAIESSSIFAINVPKKNAFKCKRIYELANILIECEKTNSKSDIFLAIKLAKMGIANCILNMEANLPLIKDEKIKSEFTDLIFELKRT